MDRFLDEQENPAPVRDRSASPNINSLIYGDPKRHHIELEAAFEMVQKVVGNSNAVFSPLKLHPDLHQVSTCVTTATSTTVSINPEMREGQQSTENMVHIANITTSLPILPQDDTANGHEPCAKRLKLDDISPQTIVLPIERPTDTSDSCVPMVMPIKTVSEAENGSHVGSVEVSIASVNSVHSLPEGTLNNTGLPSESMPARPTESVAQ